MKDKDPSTATVLFWSPLWLLSLASLLALPIGIAYAVGWFITGFEQVILIAIGCLPFILAIGLAADRVVGHHPYTDKNYRAWLAYTPWSYGKPLPKGSFHPKGPDLFTLTALGGYSYACFMLAGDLEINPVVELAPWMAFPVVFAAAVLTYLICLYSTINEDPVTTRLVILLIPLSYYPHLNPWIGIAVVCLIYLVIHIGVRRTLRRFPWNRPDWTQTTGQRFKSKLITERVIGWPYRSIGPEAVKTKKTTVLTALASGALIAWWLFAILHIAELLFFMSLEMNGITLDELLNYTTSQQSDIAGDRANQAALRLNSNRIYLYTIMFAALITALAKAAIKIRVPARPPISLLGRFATRRLIIPGYDKVYIVPLAIFMGGSVLGWVLLSLNLTPLSLTPAVMAFTLCFLYMLPYPDPEHWKYTGQFSLTRRVSLGQTTSGGSKKQGGQIEIKLPGPG